MCQQNEAPVSDVDLLLTSLWHGAWSLKSTHGVNSGGCVGRCLSSKFNSLVSSVDDTKNISSWRETHVSQYNILQMNEWDDTDMVCRGYSCDTPVILGWYSDDTRMILGWYSDDTRMILLGWRFIHDQIEPKRKWFWTVLQIEFWFRNFSWTLVVEPIFRI